MTEKIKVKSIKIKIHPENQPEFHYWATAGAYLRNLSLSAPENGGYDKIDFSITFQDGFVYGGRVDLKSPLTGNPDSDLAEHVYNHLSYLSGRRCPPNRTQEQYEKSLELIETEKRQAYGRWLDIYDIPQFDGYESLTEDRECTVCGFDFPQLKGENGAEFVCLQCQAKQKERDQREADQKRLEADPLWHLSKGPRTKVTQTIKKLLRERSGKEWSVTAGRNTSFSTIEIKAPKNRAMTQYGQMTPEDCRELALLMGDTSPIHSGGYSYRDWYYLLRAARGDFSENNWEDHFIVQAPVATHIINTLADRGALTADEVFEAYDNNFGMALSRHYLDHALYIFDKTGEVVKGEDGRYRLPDTAA